MGRAMHVLQGSGPLEITEARTPYEHPFFGQILLAAALGLIGYPDSLQPSDDGNASTRPLINRCHVKESADNLLCHK
jgi:hypothetical protein